VLTGGVEQQQVAVRLPERLLDGVERRQLGASRLQTPVDRVGPDEPDHPHRHPGVALPLEPRDLRLQSAPLGPQPRDGQEQRQHEGQSRGRVGRAVLEDGLELAGVDGRPVKAYSLGMRQQLGLALARLRRPRLLVLDSRADRQVRSALPGA